MNGVAARRNNFSEPILGFLEDAYKEYAELTGRKYGLKLRGINIKQATGPAHFAYCLQKISTFEQSDINSVLLVDEQ